ncbi:MAG: hypothetical protein WBW94_03490 [Anaerolineales bacterium]
MKRVAFVCVLFSVVLSGCSGWTVQPLPYTTSTPFPTSTPIISSPTPIILPLPITATSDVTPLAPTNTSVAPTSTETQVATATTTSVPTTSIPLTLTPSLTSTPFSAVNAEIISCNTSFDITHGMGEVTNAYVTIQNVGSADLSNICATLNALDEGRTHPDKTKCVDSLLAGYQISEKLTVDTTLKQASPIQVDITSGNNLLQRVAQNSCTNFDLIPPKMSNLGTVMPIPTP